jgi:hypothetical protein
MQKSDHNIFEENRKFCRRTIARKSPKIVIITFLKKIANFAAENLSKSPKIVIMTLIPDFRNKNSLGCHMWRFHKDAKEQQRGDTPPNRVEEMSMQN